MKRIKHVLMVLLAFVILSFGCTTFAAKALVSYPALWIMANPGEDASTQMNFIWETTSTTSRIEIAKEEDTAYASPITAPGAEVADALLATGRFVCRASIQGLTPSTTYRYRIYTNTYSADQTFTTGPANTADAAFNFIFNGDNHCYANATARATLTETMIESAEKATASTGGIDFSLNTGDFVAYGTSTSCWEQFHSISATKRMMWAMCPGNHEYYDTSANTIHGETYFNRGTNNPSNGSKGDIGNTYYFTYGETLFIAIDSESIANYSGHLATMRAWFCDVVENNPHRWIIVYQHRPFYTGDGLNAGQASTSRANWMDLFDKYGVDLVLAGHNHVYARTGTIVNNATVTGDGEGTTYITCSQIGDRYVTDAGTPMTNVAYSLVGKIDSGTIVSVTHDAISMTSIKSDGTVFDTDTIHPKTKTITDIAAFENSITVTADATFTSATLAYDDSTLGSDPVVSTSLSTVYGDGATTVPLSKNGKSAVATYTIRLRTGESYTGEVTLLNPYKNFGSLSGFSVKTDDAGVSTLSFTNSLTGPAPTAIAVQSDDEEIGSGSATDASITLSSFDPYGDHFLTILVMSGTTVLEKYYQEYASPVGSLSIDATLELETGTSQVLTVGGAEDYASDITWTSSNEAVATVSKGTVTALSSGTTTITATLGTHLATCTVTVSPQEALALTLASSSLKKGATTTVSANKTGITYASSDETVATVSADGTVTAIGKGKATITGSRGKETATVEITVKGSGCTSSAMALVPLSLIVAMTAFAFRRRKEQEN